MHLLAHHIPAVQHGQATRNFSKTLKKMGKKPGEVSKELKEKYKDSATADTQPGQRVQLARTITTVMAPTGFEFKKKDHDIPNDSLELSYVYGYQSKCGNNVAMASDGQLVYHIAGGMGSSEFRNNGACRALGTWVHRRRCIGGHPWEGVMRGGVMRGGVM